MGGTHDINVDRGRVDSPPHPQLEGGAPPQGDAELGVKFDEGVGAVAEGEGGDCPPRGDGPCTGGHRQAPHWTCVQHLPHILVALSLEA